VTNKQPPRPFIREILEIAERRLPADWHGVIPTGVFLTESQRIVAAARARGVVLRVLGGVAIRLHCNGHADLAQRMGRSIRESGPLQRQEFYDLDFAALKSQRKELPFFFNDLGYLKRRTTMATAASERHIYFHPDGWFEADIFFDKMLMEHDVHLAHRLELDYPTLTPTDLLLSKLQVTAFTEKDLKDVTLLLRAHVLSEQEHAEAINVPYIAACLARDWGFWHDVVTNLARVVRFAGSSPMLSEADRADIVEKAQTLFDRLHAQPKTLGWKVRALIGTRRQWYRPVED